MTSEAHGVPLPATGRSAQRATTARPARAKATSEWWARLRWRVNTMWGEPLTDQDLELTAEEIQAQLDYGRD